MGQTWSLLNERLGEYSDEPHTRASIIAEAAKNSHAWIPPSIGGNVASLNASDLTWSSHGDNFVSSHAPESSEKEVPESIYCMQLELQKRPRGSKIINIPGIPDHQVYYLTGNSRAQYVTLPSDPDQVQNSKKGWKGSLLIK